MGEHYKMGNENLVSLNLSETELKILESVQKEGQTLEQVVREIIKGKLTEPPTATNAQLTVDTLELVWNQLNDANELSDLRTEIAGDLLVARVILATIQKGQVDPKQVKEWAEELYA